MVFGLGGGSDNVHVDITGDSSDLRNATQGAEKALTGFQKVAGATGLAVAGAVAGGFGKAVGAAADFEEQMAEVGKVMDPAVAERMGKSIQEMATRMPLAHEELATIAATAGRLGVSEEHLESFTESVGKMAIATDLTADEAADAFARIGTLFDYPMDQAEELGSAINTMANNFGTDAGEIVDVMTRVGGAFRTLGIGTGEALGLAAAMNEVSPSSRLAAGDLQRMAKAMMDPKNVELFAQTLGMTSEEFIKLREESPEEAMLQIGEAMHESQEANDNLKASIGEAADGFETLGLNTDAAREAMEQANHQLEVGESLQKEFEVATGTFNAQITLLMNNLRNVAIIIGSVLLPHLATLVGYVVQATQRFGEWLQDGNELIAVMGGLGAMVGGLALAFVHLAPAALASVGGITALVTAVAAIGAPILGAIALAALLGKAWQSNFLNIQGVTKSALATVRAALTATMSLLNEAVSVALHNIRVIWNRHFGEIAKEASEAWAAITDTFEDEIEYIKGLFEGGGGDWLTALRFVLDTLEVILRTTLDTLLSLVRIGLHLIQGEWDEAGTVWSENVARARDRINSLIERWGLVEKIREAIDPVVSAITDALGPAYEEFVLHVWAVRGLVGRVYTQVKNAAVGAVRRLRNGVATALGAAQEKWDTHATNVKESLGTAYETARSLAVGAVNRLRWGVSFALALATDEWRTHATNTENSLTASYERVRDFAVGVANRIRTGVGAVLTRLTTLWALHGAAAMMRAQMAYTSVRNVVVGAITQLRTTVATVMDRLRTLWDEHGAKIVAVVSGVVMGTINRYIAVFSLLRQAASMVIGFLGTLWDQHRDKVVLAGSLVAGAIAGIIAKFNGLSVPGQTAIGVLGRVGLAFAGILGPIGAVIAVVALLYMAWDENLFGIQEITAGAFATIQETFTTALTVIQETVSAALAAIENWWITHKDTIVVAVETAIALIQLAFETGLAIVQEVIAGFVGVAEETWATHAESITTQVGELVSAVQEFFEVLFPILKDLTISALGAIWEFWNQHGEQIKEVVQLAFDNILLVVETALDLVFTAVDVALTLITGVFETATALLEGDWEGAWDAILATTEEIGGKILGFIERTVGRIVEFFGNLYNTLIGGSIWPEMWEGMHSNVKDVLGKIATFISTKLGEVVTKVRDALGKVADRFKSGMDSAKEKVTNGYETIKTKVTNGMDTFNTKVKNGMSNVVTKMKNGMSDTVAKVTNKLSDFKDAGGKIGTRLKTGISNKLGAVRSAAQSLRAAILDKFRSVQKPAKNIGGTVGTRLKSGVGGKVGAVRNAAQRLRAAILNKFRSIANSAKSIGGTIGSNLANGLSQSKKKLKNAGSKAAGWVRKAFGSSDAEYGPLSDQTEIGPTIATNIAEGLEATRRPVEQAAAAVAEGVRSQLAAEVMEIDLAAHIDAFAATRGVRTRMAGAPALGGDTRGRGTGATGDTVVRIDAIYASGREEGREAYEEFSRAIRSEGLDGKHR